MRIAARRRSEWLWSSHALEGRRHQVRLGGEWVDVVQMGQGDPLVLVPGLAGGWKLLAPLATRLARRYQVTIPGLRGDRFPMGTAWVRDLGEYAADLGELIERLGLEAGVQSEIARRLGVSHMTISRDVQALLAGHEPCPNCGALGERRPAG
jgi:pimeloyl-ACP methyl ester carboxylesterase